jgi:hypothetical protein
MLGGIVLLAVAFVFRFFLFSAGFYPAGILTSSLLVVFADACLFQAFRRATLWTRCLIVLLFFPTLYLINDVICRALPVTTYN